jgi:MFS family permease
LETNVNGGATIAGRIYYGYWLIAAAFFAQFVAAGVQNYVIGPFLVPMTDELGWTRAEYTIPRTLAQFVMAAIGFVIGSYVDRHGGRRFALAGTTLLVIALAALSRITTLLEWIVWNGVALTAGAALLGNLVVNVTLAKWFVELRGRAIALSSMGVSFAGVVLTPAITVAIDEVGWREAWLWLALGTALLVYPVSGLLRRAPEDHGWHPDGKSDADVTAGRAERARVDFDTSFTRGQALRTTSFYFLVLAFGLFTINIGVMLLSSVPFLTDAGYSRATAALMITVASIPALLSKPIWGYFIDKREARPLAALGAVLTGVALLVIVLAVDLRSLPLTYVGFFLLGCGWGGMIPLQEVIWASFFGRRHIGAVRSAALPFSLLLGAAAPLAVSYYFDRVGNYDGALVTVAVLNVLSSGLILAVPKPQRGAALHRR